MPKIAARLVGATAAIALALGAGAASASAATVTFNVESTYHVPQVTQVSLPSDFGAWSHHTDGGGHFSADLQAGNVVAFDRDPYASEFCSYCTAPEQNGYFYTVQPGDLNGTVTITLPGQDWVSSQAFLTQPERAVLGKINQERQAAGRPLLQDSSVLNWAADTVAHDVAAYRDSTGNYRFPSPDVTVEPVENGWPLYLFNQDWLVADARYTDPQNVIAHWTGAENTQESTQLGQAIVHDHTSNGTVDHTTVGIGYEGGVWIIYVADACNPDAAFTSRCQMQNEFGVLSDNLGPGQRYQWNDNGQTGEFYDTSSNPPHFPQGSHLTLTHICWDDDSGVDHCAMGNDSGQRVDGNDATITIDTSRPGLHSGVGFSDDNWGASGYLNWNVYIDPAPGSGNAGGGGSQNTKQNAQSAHSDLSGVRSGQSAQTMLDASGIVAAISAITSQITIGQVSGLISDQGSGLISDQGSGLTGPLFDARGNLISDQGSGLISRNGLGLISDQGAGFYKPIFAAAAKPKPKAVALAAAGHVFKAAGKAKLKIKLTKAGRKLLANWRKHALALRKRHKHVAPLKLTITYIVVPPDKKGTAVYASKRLTIKP